MVPTKPDYLIVQVFPGAAKDERHEGHRYCWCGPETIRRIGGQAVVHRDTISHRFDLSVHFLYPCIRSDLRPIFEDKDY